VLAPPGEEKLAQLARALLKRPQLRLQVRGGYRRRNDVPALKSRLARKKLAAKKNSAQTTAGPPGQVVFHDQQTRKALEAVFLENHPPAVLSALKSDFRRRQASAAATGPGSEKTDHAQTADWNEFYRNLLARIVAQLDIPDRRLEALAWERARSVRQFLVKTQKLAPGRIELLEPAHSDNASGRGVAARLSLYAAD
jgi:hypothetical protein